MEILDLLDALEDKVERCMAVPFTHKGLVNKEELLDLLQEIRMKFPDEMKQAKWVKEERQRIIADAQREAQAIVKGAEDKIVTLIDEHEITKQAYEQANQIIQKAQAHAHELRMGGNQYADEVLKGLEDTLISTVEMLRENRKELKK